MKPDFAPLPDIPALQVIRWKECLFCAAGAKKHSRSRQRSAVHAVGGQAQIEGWHMERPVRARLDQTVRRRARFAIVRIEREIGAIYPPGTQHIDAVAILRPIQP